MYYLKRIFSSLFIGFLGISMVFLGCTSDDNDVPDGRPSLIVKKDGEELPDKIDLPAESGTVSFDVDALNNEWGYDLDAGGWIIEKQRTDSTLVFEYSKETTGKSRRGDLEFWLKVITDTTKSATTKNVELAQEAGENEISEDTLAADLFDLKINLDGTAEDTSPMGMQVTTVQQTNPFETDKNDFLDQYVTEFMPGDKLGKGYKADEGSYYRVDYKNNSEFKEKIAQGHTLEVLFKFNHDYTKDAVAGESKIFSSQQSGGGSLLQVTSGKHKPKNGIAFNYYTNDDKVKTAGGKQTFVDTGITPDTDQWYHIVGVFDIKNNEAIVYVNGKKEGEEHPEGYFSYPITESQWYGIGGDAGKSGKLDGPMGGTIAIARIYSKPLSNEEVEALWDEIKNINN